MEPRAMIRRVILSTVLAFVASTCLADDPSSGPTASGQAVADALREFTASDMALVPAGLLQDSEKKDDLSSALAFASDGVVVVNVTGAKLREAIERAVSAYPQSSVGFLQLSGLEAAFKKGAPAGSRLISITVGGVKLDEAHVYSVAMPLSLQQGQLGYANLWEKSTVLRRFDKATLADVVKGRRVGSFVARWSPQG